MESSVAFGQKTSNPTSQGSSTTVARKCVAFLAYLRLLLPHGVKIRKPSGEKPESHSERTLAAAEGATAAEPVPGIVVALRQKDHLKRSKKTITPHRG